MGDDEEWLSLNLIYPTYISLLSYTKYNKRVTNREADSKSSLNRTFDIQKNSTTKLVFSEGCSNRKAEIEGCLV